MSIHPHPDLEKILTKILRFISLRPRSQKEITDRLHLYLKRYPDHDAQLLFSQVIDQLQSQGLIDDMTFALWFIRSRIYHRPRSRRRLFHELLSKGLPPHLIHQALAQAGYDESAALRQLIAKHRRHKTIPALKTYLLRQGFPPAAIQQALNSFD